MNARRKALSNRQRAFVAYYLQGEGERSLDGSRSRRARTTYLNATQAARRQVCAEIAFLNGRVHAEDWIIVNGNDEHNRNLDCEREGHDDNY